MFFFQFNRKKSLIFSWKTARIWRDLTGKKRFDLKNKFETNTCYSN